MQLLLSPMEFIYRLMSFCTLEMVIGSMMGRDSWLRISPQDLSSAEHLTSLHHFEKKRAHHSGKDKLAFICEATKGHMIQVIKSELLN